MRSLLFGFVSLAFAAPLHAEMVTKPITYEVGGKSMHSVLVYDSAVKTPRPGILMTPDWMGMNDDQVALAKRIAGEDYVILVADVYGVDVRPKNPAEAQAATDAMYKNRAELRARVNGALDQLKKQVGNAPLDGRNWGAIGFCFGGAATLDLARSGASVGAVVTFHANLSSDPAFHDAIRARVLVLHGGDDKFESPDQVAGFQNEMREAHADWEMLIYGGAVHCFAIPTATGTAPGCQYNPLVAKRAFAQMHAFFDDVFVKSDATPTAKKGGA